MSSCFTPGDNAIDQLVYLYHTLCDALDKKKDVRIVFVIFQKHLIECGMLVLCTNFVACV